MADETEQPELKTIKFQMMLSPGEAEQIDDWGFKRRIKSRAESIRRLVQLGIVVEEAHHRTLTSLLSLLGAVQTPPLEDPDSALQYVGKVNASVLELAAALAPSILQTMVAQIGMPPEELSQFSKDLERVFSDPKISRGEKNDRFTSTLKALTSGLVKKSPTKQGDDNSDATDKPI